MSKRQARVWAGIDAGKGHHWAAVVDEAGATLWSKKIDNDESAILAALGFADRRSGPGLVLQHRVDPVTESLKCI